MMLLPKTTSPRPPPLAEEIHGLDEVTEFSAIS
jgi:hypothetical protein